MSCHITYFSFSVIFDSQVLSNFLKMCIQVQSKDISLVKINFCFELTNTPYSTYIYITTGENVQQQKNKLDINK